MRRITTILVALTSLAVLAGGVAQAESQTVNGEGDITKIIADNGSNAVTVRVFGLGKPCGGAQHMTVSVLTPLRKTTYFAEAGCYSGGVWGKGLWYTPTGAAEDAVEVSCANFELARNKTTGAFRIFMPRSCLPNAPNKVRIKVTGQNFGTLTGGQAGPTKVLTRG